MSELWQLAVSTRTHPKALRPAAANAVASVTCRSRVIEAQVFCGPKLIVHRLCLIVRHLLLCV